MNILLHHVSFWPGVPKRNLSSFATHNKGHTANFGRCYICVPADSVKSFAWIEFDLNEPPNGQYLDSIIDKVDQVCIQLKRIRAERHLDKPISEILINRMQDEGVESYLDFDFGSPLPSNKLSDMVRFIDNLIKDAQKFEKLDSEDSTSEEKQFLYYVTWLKQELDTKGFLSLRDALDDFTAKEAGCVVSNSIKDIPNKRDEDASDEIWFEGPYLLLYSESLNEHELLTTALKYC